MLLFLHVMRGPSSKADIVDINGNIPIYTYSDFEPFG